MIDPVAFTVFGWSVHWYGILWAAGFALFYFVALRHGGRILNRQSVAAEVDALLFYGGIGALVGGRIGYVFFY
ncbi:MAG: prolipoprotein diacylglyceryl transferase, partial [Betaproteobacteria bacterium]|nr:prolipoprotein diacylglyceryl transferase [Betaproteobacteria bacterium]